MTAAAAGLGLLGWFAEPMRFSWPDGARRVRGHHAGPGDRRGPGALDPGGRTRLDARYPCWGLVRSSSA
jgi:hypothetical protein